MTRPSEAIYAPAGGRPATSLSSMATPMAPLAMESLRTPPARPVCCQGVLVSQGDTEAAQVDAAAPALIARFRMLSDEQIAAMTPEQRRALILRLGSPIAEVLPVPAQLRRLRRIRVAVTVGGSVLLVPWILYLGKTLPGVVRVDNWQTVWVGYDLLLMLMLATSAWLGWRRRQAMILTLFGTGLLVLADAWFDITTSSRDDQGVSFAAALLIELPVAVLLMSAAVRLLRLSTARLLVLSPHASFWRLPLLILDDDDLQHQARQLQQSSTPRASS